MNRFFPAVSRSLLWRLPRIAFRGLKTNVADLRKGDWINHEGRYLVVQSVTSAHSGRGARQFLVHRITTKEAMSNQVVLIKPNSRDDFEKMEMKDYTSQFMYQNDNELVFMNTKTFEEYSVPSQLVDSNLLKLLEGGTPVKVRMSESKPIMVTSNPTIKCTVVEVAEAKESSDAKKKMCIAVVQGGARIGCTVIVAPGDSILVNLDDLSFNSRA